MTEKKQNIIEFYHTIKQPYGPEEFKEKGSRFLSYLFPVSTLKEVETRISELRKKYHDANHVCPAFRLGEGTEEYIRFSDDGEPGGTAGLPIFNEIKSKNYFNILAVVIRYFGGIKLGTGGLVRAYSASARQVLQTAQSVTVYLKKKLILEFPYEFTGEIMQVVNRYDLDIVNRDYTGTGAALHLAIPVGRVDEVARSVSDISGGKLRLQGVD